MHRFVFVMLTFGFLPLTPLAAQQGLATVTTTGRFALRSDARVALHHFLIDWATADGGEWPPYALQLSEREDWESVLDDRERQAWRAAVDSYGAAVGRSLLFDEGLVALRDWAAGGAEGVAPVPTSDAPLADALINALPIYQRHWWPAHHDSNRRWIASVATRLDAVEDDMIARFEAAYGGQWPDARIPIDMMVYANAVGAYSTGGRLTISSAYRGLQMPQAIEMIFHEASHTDEMEQPLRAAVSEAFAAAGVAEPDRFWHDVSFFTSGDITRLVLAEHGEPQYRHYGSFGVYRRAERWVTHLPAFEAYWREFLESGSTDPGERARALAAVAAQVGRER